MVSEKVILLSVSGFGSNTNFNLLGMLTLVAENVGYICLLGSPSSVTGSLCLRPNEYSPITDENREYNFVLWLTVSGLFYSVFIMSNLELEAMKCFVPTERKFRYTGYAHGNSFLLVFKLLKGMRLY